RQKNSKRVLAVLHERRRERPVDAVRVRHHRALAGAVWVRLKNLDALRQDAIGVDRSGVFLDLRPRTVAQDAFVHEGEMADVEKVLDDAAQREPGAAGDAQVAPRVIVAARAPEHDVLAQQPCGRRAATGEVFDPRDRMPVLDEDRVIDHRRRVYVGSGYLTGASAAVT